MRVWVWTRKKPKVNAKTADGHRIFVIGVFGKLCGGFDKLIKIKIFNEVL